MYNDWLKHYCGLGAFRGLEPQPTENMVTVMNMNGPSDPMKAFGLKDEKKKCGNLTFPKTEIKYDIEDI